MSERRSEHWEIPGLPGRWPELLADALSELGNDEFEEAWRAIGKGVRARCRAIRAGSARDAVDAQTLHDSPGSDL